MRKSMETVSLPNRHNYFFLKKKIPKWAFFRRFTVILEKCNHKMGIFPAIYGNFRKMQLFHCAE